jgi:hypothetical protein
LAKVVKPMFETRLPIEPRTRQRRDVYALTTLVATYELALGVVAEAKARRAVNCTRLARHLAEFDLQSAWILQDPEARLTRPWGEELRILLERISEELFVIPQAARESLAEQLTTIRDGIPAGERYSDGRVMPGFKAMAKALGRIDEYGAGYQPMSWTAHPGLSAGGRFMTIVDEAGGTTTGASMPTTKEALASACRAAHCLARCIERLAPDVGAALSPEFNEARSIASLTCGHVQDLMGR